MHAAQGAAAGSDATTAAVGAMKASGSSLVAEVAGSGMLGERQALGWVPLAGWDTCWLLRYRCNPKRRLHSWGEWRFSWRA